VVEVEIGLVVEAVEAQVLVAECTGKLELATHQVLLVAAQALRVKEMQAVQHTAIILMVPLLLLVAVAQVVLEQMQVEQLLEMVEVALHILEQPTQAVAVAVPPISLAIMEELLEVVAVAVEQQVALEQQQVTVLAQI
jgi:hypothetical protein